MKIYNAEITYNLFTNEVVKISYAVSYRNPKYDPEHIFGYKLKEIIITKFGKTINKYYLQVNTMMQNNPNNNKSQRLTYNTIVHDSVKGIMPASAVNNPALK